MMALKLINQISQNENFISAREFARWFKVGEEESVEILNQGLAFGIFYQTSNNENKVLVRYAVKQVVIEQIKIEQTTQELLDFNDFLERFFGNLRADYNILDEELTELKDKVLNAIASRKRTYATELLVNKFEFDNFIYTTKDDKASEMWIYSDGIYIPEGKSCVKEFCRLILAAAYTPQLANEVIAKIEADTYIDQDKFFNNNYVFEVPILDGILDLRTKEVYPFSPKKIFFNKLPIKFNKDAACPKIIQHFKDVLREKEDYKVLLELFGYCLLKENKFEKAFIFVGDGGNGKTKTLEILKRFVGIDNCSSVALGEMQVDSFKISEIFGKMVNLAGDIDNQELKNTGLFKGLTGRDLISAKRKFKNDIKFISYAKNIFACNELPRVYDLSKGFWRRWVLLEFPYEFIDKDDFEKLSEEQRKFKKIKNPDIVKELTTEEELSGLLNESIKALDRLLKNKRFSYSKGTQDVMDFWIRKSDSFTAFCFDCLEEYDDERIPKETLRKEYSKYCRQHKLRGTSDKSIMITLQNMFGVGEIRDEFMRYWLGIKFKNYNSCQDCHGFSTYNGSKISNIGLKRVSKVSVDDSETKIEVEKIR